MRAWNVTEREEKCSFLWFFGFLYIRVGYSKHQFLHHECDCYYGSEFLDGHETTQHLFFRSDVATAMSQNMFNSKNWKLCMDIPTHVKATQRREIAHSLKSNAFIRLVESLHARPHSSVKGLGMLVKVLEFSVVKVYNAIGWGRSQQILDLGSTAQISKTFKVS